MTVSTARHEKARQTHRRICDAARELFLSRGYAATTITDIGKAAGVAHQTVYFVFGSKAGVLAAIMDVEIVGDAEPVPLLERPQVRRLTTVADNHKRLERIIAVALDVTERLAPLYEIVRGGAADDEVGQLLDRHEEQRWQSLRAMVGLVEGDLVDLDGDAAADQLFALASHEVYWLLVRRRGWSSKRWREFVTSEADRQLLSG